MSQNFTKSLNWKQFKYCGGKYAARTSAGFPQLQSCSTVAMHAAAEIYEDLKDGGKDWEICLPVHSV